MREYKFRGKRLDNGEWVNGFGAFMWEDDGIQKAEIYSTHGVYEVDPETVGQYTGLKDRNGKEVYDGDYLLDRESYDEIYYYEVVWSKSNACFYFRDVFGNEHFGGEDIEWSQTEVIGNRWDNPDLLEGGYE